MYKRVTTDLDFVKREKEVLEFWKKNRIFEKCNRLNSGKEPFTFYDGPPTANGKPHIGHILTRSIKDLLPRYKSMKGYDVLRKAGWDTHGLPVELEVERQLGLDGKEQIENYGVEAFIRECKKSVWKYKEEWERMSDRVGYWADMDNPYITYENSYIESVWWSLKRIHEAGLLYKGHKVVPYCPRCGTALSSHEVAQGYRDVAENSIFVKFRLKDGTASILAWTTTPWTLPSNAGLCVNGREEYARARINGEELILAKKLVEPLLGENAEIIETFPGTSLVGLKYEPLFGFTPHDSNSHFVVADSFVSLDDGSGVVHMAPAFGEDDARVGGANNLPFIQLVDERGCFTGGTPWDGMFVKKADPLIIETLEKENKLFKIINYEHSYPFCWRCDTPLLYYARSTWFIRMTAVRDMLNENNRRINWLPENIKEGRMGNFLENVIDWGLSRERYWGTPLPVWECASCGNIHVIGSVAELREMAVEPVADDLELHKPYIDRVRIKCPKCGDAMDRVSEVIDCWYDSGAMPFAQWHYPFENKEEFERRFPAHFISEAVDQTRGWFYTLLAISTCIFGREPFENCIVLGHVQDKDGQKMSKHKGNVVDPWTTLEKQGADAVRWYFYTGSAPWLPIRFFDEAVGEGQRKFMGTLWNTYAFYVLYAEIDKFDPTKYTLDRSTLSLMDRWLLSRLNSVIRDVTAYMDAYRITEAGRTIQQFVDELSNWYVRRGRERYWGSDMTTDKISAYMTLYTALESLTRLAAPFVPFMTEAIYQNLVRSVDKSAPESVHLCAYPEADESFIDAELEENMDFVLTAVTLGRACRNAESIKNRQPLSELYVCSTRKLPEMFTDLIADELNVKKVIFTNDAGRFTRFIIKPQLRTLGKKYRQLIPKISEHLMCCDCAAAVSAVRGGGLYCFDIDGTRVELSEEDMLIEARQQEGFTAMSDRDCTVVLNTALTPELIEEGLVREIISKVQSMRKDAGFDVQDHIRLRYTPGTELAEVIERNSAEIAENVLADDIAEGEAAYKREWDINGYTVTLGVEKV